MTRAPVVTTRVRDADADETDFFTLVAAEAGISRTHRRRPDLVRVAVHDGQVAGFAAATLPVDTGNDADLDYLFVHRDRRGHGVGRSLLDDLCRTVALLGAGGVTITAHPASAGFFDRTAAVRIGTQPARDAARWSSPVYRLTGPLAVGQRIS